MSFTPKRSTDPSSLSISDKFKTPLTTTQTKQQQQSIVAMNVKRFNEKTNTMPQEPPLKRSLGSQPLKQVRIDEHQNSNSNSSTNQVVSADTNHIIVGVRLCPLDAREKQKHQQLQQLRNNQVIKPNLSAANPVAILVNIKENEIIVNDKQNKQNKFVCDFLITDQKSSGSGRSDKDLRQQYVYESIGEPLLTKAFDGYNVSVFAYGQTGSGKTYSMIGSDQEPGLIPRFCTELFNRIPQSNSQATPINSTTMIQISYYEIYNEKIYDLLRNTTNQSTNPNQPARHLQIRENPVSGPYIVDLMQLSATSAQDAQLWLNIGTKRRATACTNLNQKSSRSHSVFQITLTQMLEKKKKRPQVNWSSATGDTSSEEGTNSILQLVTSRINLVDLAGSERIGKGSDEIPSSSNSKKPFECLNAKSDTFKEGTCINKSLLTLRKIICALSESAGKVVRTNVENNDDVNSKISGNGTTVTQSTPHHHNVYLPYRDSALTWLLKDSLGGNSKTAMLATISSQLEFVEESLCTLRYAAKASRISTKAQLNRDYRHRFVNELGNHIEMSLVVNPMLLGSPMRKPMVENSKEIEEEKNNSKEQLRLLQEQIKQMQHEWAEKLAEAERCKQQELAEMENAMQLQIGVETETATASCCCLINLNEDPSLSEKLIYLLKCKGDGNELKIGSDKVHVQIHLSGPLIAPVHCVVELDEDKCFLRHLDSNYVTYLNGELVQEKSIKQLTHGDRIVFGGTHYFRFSNPKNREEDDLNKFTDYQFAKEEMERKQSDLIQAKLNEELNKCRLAGDRRVQELLVSHEQRVAQLEQENRILEQERNIKERQLKQLIKSQQVASIENTFAETQMELNQVNEHLEKKREELLLLNKTNNNRTIECNETNALILHRHTIGSTLFAITLGIREANNICTSIQFPFQFKRFDLKPEKQSNFDYIHCVCVIDKRLQLATLWHFSTFQTKLQSLRNIYEAKRFAEEEEEEEIQTAEEFMTNSMDEWQKWTPIDDTEFISQMNFSERIVQNVYSIENEDEKEEGENNKETDNDNEVQQPKKTLKRRISSLLLLNKNGEMTKEVQKRPRISDMNMSTASSTNTTASTTSNVQMCSLFLYENCRDILNCDDEDEFDDDDDDEEDEEMENEEDEEQKMTTRMQLTIPKIDDKYLKFYARLILNINRLVNCHEQKKEQQGTSIDESLYSMRIIKYCNQLDTFKPDYWSLVNGDNRVWLKQKYVKIVRLVKLIKQNIGCLFQAIINNLDSMMQSKREQLQLDFVKLMQLHGEYVFLNCSNVVLNKDSFILNSLDEKFLKEYENGLDKQYDIYLRLNCVFLNEKQSKLCNFMESMKQFKDNYKKLREKNWNNCGGVDTILEYCNYVLACHFRISNALKVYIKQMNMNDIGISESTMRLKEKVLKAFYNILIDSLKLTKALKSMQDEETNDSVTTDAEFNNDDFILAFRELKHKFLNISS